MTKKQEKELTKSIVLEALDYGKYLTKDSKLNEYGEDYVYEVFRKIVAEVKKHKVKNLILTHYTNFGSIKSQDLVKISKTGKDYLVDFCQCGRVNHWGKFYEFGENPYTEEDEDQFTPLWNVGL